MSTEPIRSIGEGDWGAYAIAETVEQRGVAARDITRIQRAARATRIGPNKIVGDRSRANAVQNIKIASGRPPVRTQRSRCPAPEYPRQNTRGLIQSGSFVDAGRVLLSESTTIFEGANIHVRVADHLQESF